MLIAICALLQAVLSKSGKASVLAEMEENDPDAAGGDDDEENELSDRLCDTGFATNRTDDVAVHAAQH